MSKEGGAVCLVGTCLSSMPIVCLCAGLKSGACCFSSTCCLVTGITGFSIEGAIIFAVAIDGCVRYFKARRIANENEIANENGARDVIPIEMIEDERIINMNRLPEGVEAVPSIVSIDNNEYRVEREISRAEMRKIAPGAEEEIENSLGIGKEESTEDKLKKMKKGMYDEVDKIFQNITIPAPKKKETITKEEIGDAEEIMLSPKRKKIEKVEEVNVQRPSTPEKRERVEENNDERYPLSGEKQNPYKEEYNRKIEQAGSSKKKG